MENSLARSWWAWVVRGVIAILFGIAAFALPGLTLTTLVLLFAAFAALDGLFALASIALGRTGARAWWSVLIEGLVGLGFAVAAFAYPGITLVALLYMVAGWSLATGIFEIAAAIRLRREITGEWALALAGILSVVFGFVLVALPAAGLIAMAWMIGVYAVLFGGSMIALGVRLKRGLLPVERDRTSFTGRPVATP